MGPKHFQRQKFSLFLVKFKKLGLSAPLRVHRSWAVFAFFSKITAWINYPVSMSIFCLNHSFVIFVCR